MKPRPTLESFATGVLSGDRVILAQAITLLESQLREDEELGSALLEKIIPHTGNSVRIGITGVPGVGKSTFIESLGNVILKNNNKLAVLSIDPTSPVGGGSILGDKTRMGKLSKHPSAFIRPSASTNATGGVAQRTREAMLLCEAAGFNVVIIETVGVGQSEYAVKDMVDFFLLLMLAGAGDDLQGMKKGIMELADAIAITKADGDNLTRARQAQATYAQAMHTTRNGPAGTPPVWLTSAFNQTGIEEVWTAINGIITDAKKSTSFENKRKQQYASWFHDQFASLLKSDVQQFASVRTARELLEAEVTSLQRSPANAALELLSAYHHAIKALQS